MQWNRDTNGNPVSVSIPAEVQQVSPNHGVVQLVQVPDQHYRVKIVTEDNVALTEVFNQDEVTGATFFVDYGTGIIKFDRKLYGKVVKVAYYGRGVMLISDSRIFHKDGENVADTWDNILERSKDALELIESAGGLVEAIETIDKKVEEGNKVADRIEDFITETQFYGYTITLSREAFVVKADENGEVGKSETATVYTDVIVYKGAKQIVPTLTITDELGSTWKIDGQRATLSSIDINVIKAGAVLNIDCGDNLVAKRVLEVTKVFDGVNQYNVEMSNSFYSFETEVDGTVSKEQTITCEVQVTKANVTHGNFTLSVQGLPKGLQANVNGTSVDFIATKGNLLPSSGTCLVVVTIDGVAHTKAFSWNKNRKGQDAKSLVLIGGQILRYEQPDFSDIPTPYRTVLTAKVAGLSGTPKWYISEENEWKFLEGQTGQELIFLHNDPVIWGNRKEITIKCELDGYSDEMTIVKLANGATGKDSITVVLTNENHTVAMDASGNVSEVEIGRTKTDVLAFVGTTSVTPQITIGACTGCEVAIDGQTVKMVSIDSSHSSSTAILNVRGNVCIVSH